MTKRLAELTRWPRIPRRRPKEPTCSICGCTESRACRGGCGWLHLDRDRNVGVCTACDNDRICRLAENLIAGALYLDRWRRRKSCPCPFCRPRRKGAPL